jgi:23S rRNA (cytidine1920-2'-O)/16S rRNA (cytidine1409-2'-O)-methyltransferase
VRDPADQAGAMAQVLQAAQDLGWNYHGLTWSPLVGPAGNLEYLLWLQDMPGHPAPDPATLKHLAQTAQQTLLKSGS